MYEQSAKALKGQAALIASVNFAGLAGSIALRTKNPGYPLNADLLLASILCFSIDLITSLGPAIALSDKHKEDLTAIMSAMDDKTSR